MNTHDINAKFVYEPKDPRQLPFLSRCSYATELALEKGRNTG